MFPRLAFALKKTLSSWRRRAKSKSDVPQVVGPVVSPTPGSPIPTARAFDAGLPLSDAEFRAIAGLPAKRLLPLPPPKAIKQGPKSKMLQDFEAAMLPKVLASLRRLPAKRPVRRTAASIKQGPKSAMLEDFSKASMPLILANLNRARLAHLSEFVGSDGIPTLDDDDPADWNTAAAVEATQLAAAAIARAASH